jgi:predicted DNA-binding protein (MmcQ/YjbR family)
MAGTKRASPGSRASGGFGAAEAALRAHAMAKPEATEHFPWGERAIKVKGKVFLFMYSDASKLSLSTKLPESNGVALMLPFAQPTGYGLGKAGWVSARRYALLVDRRELPGGRARQARIAGARRGIVERRQRQEHCRDRRQARSSTAGHRRQARPRQARRQVCQAPRKAREASRVGTLPAVELASHGRAVPRPACRVPRANRRAMSVPCRVPRANRRAMGVPRGTQANPTWERQRERRRSRGPGSPSEIPSTAGWRIVSRSWQWRRRSS